MDAHFKNPLIDSEKATDESGLEATLRPARLVDYVCMVDERIPVGELPEFPTLSNIFSGMLLIEKEPAAQFAKGIAILRRVVAARLDPYDTMPDCEAWRPFAEAKEANFRLVKETLEQAEYYLSRRGRKVGYVESTAIGGIGTLYEQGCEVAVMFNPAFGEPPMPKFTIAGNQTLVIAAKPAFDELEAGWGGPGDDPRFAPHRNGAY